MTADAENTIEKQRGRPFQKGQSGNPAGKPKGARNKATLAVEALLDGEAEELTRKAIELAKAGDIPALRICLDRRARAAGATRIFLETEAPNDSVRRFYRRHGFVDEESVWLQRRL